MDSQFSSTSPETSSEKPKRSYTTLSISHEIKRELEQMLYSSGKAQKYNDLLREMITDRKAKLELAAQKATRSLPFVPQEPTPEKKPEAV